MNEILKSTREGGIFPPPSTKGGEKLPGQVPLSPLMIIENCEERISFPITQKVCTVSKTQYYFAFGGCAWGGD